MSTNLAKLAPEDVPPIPHLGQLSGADVEGIVTLTEQIRERMLQVGRARGRVGRIHPSVNAFVPKPGTPYQWLPMEDPKESDRKLQYLRKAFGRRLALAVDCPVALAGEASEPGEGPAQAVPGLLVQVGLVLVGAATGIIQFFLDALPFGLQDVPELLFDPLHEGIQFVPVELILAPPLEPLNQVLQAGVGTPAEAHVTHPFQG